jgi:PilZ domain
MDNEAERREARRFTMNLPLSILPWEHKGDELPVNMRDVSYRGLYFFAGEQFEAGREIAFVITLPKDLLKSGDVKIRCRGKVVRVDPGENGKLGIAAKIDRYEFIPSGAVA